MRQVAQFSTLKIKILKVKITPSIRKYGNNSISFEWVVLSHDRF